MLTITTEKEMSLPPLNLAASSSEGNYKLTRAKTSSPQSSPRKIPKLRLNSLTSLISPRSSSKDLRGRSYSEGAGNEPPLLRRTSMDRFFGRVLQRSLSDRVKSVRNRTIVSDLERNWSSCLREYDKSETTLRKEMIAPVKKELYEAIRIFYLRKDRVEKRNLFKDGMRWEDIKKGEADALVFPLESPYDDFGNRLPAEDHSWNGYRLDWVEFFSDFINQLFTTNQIPNLEFVAVGTPGGTSDLDVEIKSSHKSGKFLSKTMINIVRCLGDIVWTEMHGGTAALQAEMSIFPLHAGDNRTTSKILNDSGMKHYRSCSMVGIALQGHQGKASVQSDFVQFQTLCTESPDQKSLYRQIDLSVQDLMEYIAYRDNQAILQSAVEQELVSGSSNFVWIDEMKNDDSFNELIAQYTKSKVERFAKSPRRLQDYANQIRKNDPSFAEFAIRSYRFPLTHRISEEIDELFAKYHNLSDNFLQHSKRNAVETAEQMDRLLNRIYLLSTLRAISYHDGYFTEGAYNVTCSDEKGQKQVADERSFLQALGKSKPNDMRGIDAYERSTAIDLMDNIEENYLMFLQKMKGEVSPYRLIEASKYLTRVTSSALALLKRRMRRIEDKASVAQRDLLFMNFQQLWSLATSLEFVKRDVRIEPSIGFEIIRKEVMMADDKNGFEVAERMIKLIHRRIEKLKRQSTLRINSFDSQEELHSPRSPRGFSFVPSKHLFRDIISDLIEQDSLFQEPMIQGVIAGILGYKELESARQAREEAKEETIRQFELSGEKVMDLLTQVRNQVIELMILCEKLGQRQKIPDQKHDLVNIWKSFEKEVG